ncbi:MAG: GntR family transcriptional regulator [Niabella sp.]
MQHQYQKLKNKLKGKILKGSYKPGDVIPSEHDLMEQYNLARSTVRQALDELVKEGFIVKCKGRKSIVAENKKKALGLFSVKGFSAVVGEEGEVKTVFLRKPYKVSWDKNFFYPLTAKEMETGAICIERLRSVGEFPVMLEYTYIPDNGIEVLSQKDFVNNSLFETLRTKYGIDIERAEQELVATGAAKETAGVFNIKPGSPVLHVYRKYHTNKPGFFIYSSFYCYTGKFSIGNLFQ